MWVKYLFTVKINLNGGGRLKFSWKLFIDPKTTCAFQTAVGCRVAMVMMQYSILANNYWLLVEGIYLHSLLVATVLTERNYFGIYLCIGWGERFRAFTPWTHKQGLRASSYMSKQSVADGLCLIRSLSFSFSLRCPSDICVAVGDREVLVREWRVSSGAKWDECVCDWWKPALVKQSVCFFAAGELAVISTLSL